MANPTPSQLFSHVSFVPFVVHIDFLFSSQFLFLFPAAIHNTFKVIHEKRCTWKCTRARWELFYYRFTTTWSLSSFPMNNKTRRASSTRRMFCLFSPTSDALLPAGTDLSQLRRAQCRQIPRARNSRFFSSSKSKIRRHDFSTQNISEGWKSRKEVELFSVPSARYGRRAIAINATSSKSRRTDLPTAIVSLAECTRLTFLRTNRRRSWLRFRRRPTRDEKSNSDRTASVENGVKFQFEYQHASHKWRFMLHEFKINQHEQSFCETN